MRIWLRSTTSDELKEWDSADCLHSIVAVHGLNPINKEYHAEQTWTAGESLWLRDLLPKRAPTVRVLLFGYNSNIAFETSTAGVLEQAESLLNQLKFKRAVRGTILFLLIIIIRGWNSIRLGHAKDERPSF